MLTEGVLQQFGEAVKAINGLNSSEPVPDDEPGAMPAKVHVFSRLERKGEDIRQVWYVQLAESVSGYTVLGEGASIDEATRGVLLRLWELLEKKAREVERSRRILANAKEWLQGPPAVPGALSAGPRVGVPPMPGSTR